MSGEKKFDAYRAADAYVLPSRFDVFSIGLVEAMAAGHPIACSHFRPMPDILGDAGVYFDPERPDDVARAIRELIGSHELRTRLASRAHALASQ